MLSIKQKLFRNHSHTYQGLNPGNKSKCHNKTEKSESSGSLSHSTLDSAPLEVNEPYLSLLQKIEILQTTNQESIKEI